MEPPKGFRDVLFSVILTLSVIHSVYTVKVNTLKEFQDVDGMEDISCEKSLGFRGQRNNLLDSPTKVSRFASSLPAELQKLFGNINKSPTHDVSIFTGKELTNLLSYMRKTFQPQDMLAVLQPKQLLTSGTPTQIADMLKKWTPAFRLLQTSNNMCELNKMIELDAFGHLCKHLSSFDTTVQQMSLMEDRCAHCTAYYVKKRDIKEMTGVLDGGKGRVLYNLIRKAYGSDWDLHMLRLSPGSVRADDVGRVTSKHFSDKAQLQVLMNKDIWMHFDRKVMAALGKALLTALGPLSSWTSGQMKSLGQFVMSLPESKLEEILTPQLFFDIDSDLLEYPMADQFFSIGVWKVVDYFEDPAKKPEFDGLPGKKKLICLILRFAPMESLFDNLITVNMTRHAMMDCKETDDETSKLTFLLKKIVNDPKFDWSSIALLQIDDLMPLLPTSLLENITDQDLMKYWAHKEATFDYPMAKAIMKRLKEDFNFKAFTCREMGILQEGILTLTGKDLDVIPLPVFSKCASHYLHFLDDNCHYNPRVCNYIWTLIKKSGKETKTPIFDLMQNMTGEFVEEFVPTKDIQDIEIDDEDDDEDLADLSDVHTDGKRAKALFRRVRHKYGNMTTQYRNMTRNQNAVKLFGKGATVEDLQNLPEDESLMDVLPEIASDVGKGNRKKTSVMYDKLHNVLGMDKMTEDDICIEEEMEEDFAPLFTQASKDDLDKLNPKSKKGILRSIGEKKEYVQQMTRPKLRSFFKVQYNSTGLNGSDQITPDEIEKVGPHLFCGMTKDEAVKLRNDSLFTYIEMLAQCDQLDQETRGELASKYTEAHGGLKKMLKSPTQLKKMGSLLSYIDVDVDLTKKEKEKLKIVSDEVRGKFSERQNRLKERNSRDVPDEEKEAEKHQRSTFNKKLIQLTSKNDEGIDCSTLHKFDGEIEFLETDELKKMKSSEFEDCMEEFHRAQWDKWQLKEIGTKLKKLYGDDTNRWTANITMRVGPLIRAFDPSEIKKMEFSKDSLAYIGLYDIGGEKASSVIQKLMKDKVIANLSDIPADLLGSIGQLVCGFSPEKIKLMNATAVLGASSSFSDVDCLDEDQMEALMNKLEEQLGSDWSDFEPDTIEEFGSLMGGASEDILKSLKEEQLASVDGKALGKIPPKKFAKAFSADKLKELTDDQAMHLKSDQVWRMDRTQRQALANFTKNAGFSVPKAKHGSKKVSSSKDFQKSRNLPRSSCGSSLSFAGQRDKLLDSPQKVSKFEGTLKGDKRSFFKKIVESEDHSIDQFTEDEMKSTLEYLTESVSEDDREDFLSILDNLEYISDESLRAMLEEWPPYIHLLQKPEVMCEVTDQLDEELLETFCNRIIDSDVTAAVTTEILERCAQCAVLRFVDRKNHGHMPPMEDAKASVFMRKLRQMNMPDWDLRALAIAPGALKPEDIDNIKDLKHFRNESELEVFMDDDVSCCLKDEVKRKLAKKIREALGPLSSWSDDVVDLVGQFVPYLSDSVLESELTGEVVMKNLEHLEPEKEVSDEEKKMYRSASRKLAEHMERNMESVTKDKKMKAFCLLAKFPPKQSSVDYIYNTDEIKEGLLNCSDWQIDKEMSVRALSKIIKSRNKTWDDKDIRIMKDFPSGVTSEMIDAMNKTTLSDKWEEINDAEFSMPVLRSTWNKIKPYYNVSKLDCNQLMKMGKIFFVLSLQEVDKIPDEALGDCLDYLSSMVGTACDEERKICDKMWKKISHLTSVDQKRSKPEMFKKLDPKFVKFVPSEDLKNMSIKDLGGFDKIGEMDLDESQAEAVMEILEREKGPVTKDNLNYTGRHLKKLGNVFMKGASPESIENLPEGTELLDSLADMKRNMKSMKDGKADAVYGKLRTMFGIDTDSDKSVCLDESTIKQSAGFFTKASGEDLKKLDDVTRKSVLSEIGKDRDAVKTMSRDRVREQFRVLKETENFENKDQITDDDVDRYGTGLFCGIEKDDVRKFPAKILEKNFGDLDNCDQLDQETRKEIANKFVSDSNGFSELLKNPDKLKAMGSFMLNADLPDPDTITPEQKGILGSVASDIMTEVNKRKRRLESRSDNDIPSSEKTEDKLLRNDLAQKLWSAVSESADCPTIQSFEGDLEFFTVDVIDGVDPGVITDCLSEFQDVDWNKEQLEKFGEKIKKSFGNDTGKWNKDRVMRTGKLISGLDSDDIDKMKLDADVMGVIGQREVAEPKKMFKKFKKDAGISNMSSVDSDVLSGLGNMVCGIEASDMEDIKDYVIKDIVKDLGTIKCLDDDQLEVISKKYESSITDKELEEMDVGKMGVLAGGLSEDKLKKLNRDQVSRIPPDAIKKMKPETVAKAFSSDKMSRMTREQVTAMDPKVLRKMGVKQLIAVENVAKGRKDVNATEEAMNRTERFYIDLPKNVSLKSLDTFKEVRNLPSDNCGGVSFAGQEDSRLDTPSKRADFIKSLPDGQAAMFTRITTSPDHDVSQFTTFEMRNILKFLTNDLDKEDQDNFINLRTEFSKLTKEALNTTLQTWSPRVYLLMKPQLMCSTLGLMDIDSLETFCERLTDRDVTTTTFIEVLNRCGDCLAVAHAHRTDEDMIGIMSGFKGKAFYDKLRQWKPSNWDIYHLMFAPDSLEKKDIGRITNQNHFKDIGQIYRLADPRFFENVPKPVMERLANNLQKALGSFSDWSFIESNMLLPYILNFPPKILKKEMTVTMVLSILSNVEDIMGVASEKFMSISAWKITDYLVKKAKSVPSDIKKKAFCIVLKYTNHKKLWKSVYSTSEILECLPDCASYDIRDKTITNLIRRVVRSRSFKWNQEGFDTLGDFIAAVPMYTLKKVDPNLLYANWDKLGNLDFGINKLRILWNLIKSKVNLKRLDCADIQHLGRALLILRSKDIKKIPDKAVGDCAMYLGVLLKDTCKKRKFFCQTLWEKLKVFAQNETLPIGSVVKDLGEGFVQYIPRKDIETIDIDDLGGVDSLSNLKLSEDQAPIMMRKVKKDLGPVGKNNANYSSKAVMKMGPVFYHGASGSDFEILPEDSSLLEMLPHMAKYFDNINEKKIEVVFKKLKKIFAVDKTNNICLDRALTEQIAMFFTTAKAEDLRKFSDDTKKVIFQTMGGKYDYIKRMSRNKVQELFSVLMEVDSLGSKESYDEEDVGNYKYMWCGLKSAQADKMNEEAVDGYMGAMKDCVHFEPETRESLVKRSITLSGSLSDLLTSNPKRLEDLGSLIIDANVDDMKALNSDAQEVFISRTQELMKSVKEVQNQAKKRPSAEISKDEKQADDDKLKKVGRAILDMHKASSASDSSRRKRATTPVDCPTIRNFNGALSFLTAEEISTMENDEFQDCLAEFQSTKWGDSQLEAFQAQLIASFGSDTSTWTQANVLAAGILLDSLNSSHIQNLTVLDDDTVSSLGSNVFTKNAPHIMTTYMTTQNITDLSRVDSKTLGNVGNLVCGFDTGQMSAMEPSTIDGASSDLSSVSCLESDQLTTLGNKIVEIRGTDWTGATSDQISSLGVLAGGLPASVLEDIGTDELSSISPKAVENMSPATFASVFTAEKINSLSSTQANSVTADQKSQLSEEQLRAVSYVATTANDNNDESGARGHSSNLVTAFVFVILVVILH